MIAKRSRIAEAFVLALALALTLMLGYMCFASEHALGCGDGSPCPICHFEDCGMELAIPASMVTLAASAAFIRCGGASVAAPRAGSPVCFRIRMDD